jgi:hypothetical protein
MLLAQAERRLGVAERLARAISDARDPDRIIHLLADILRASVFVIACGYEDADDLDRLRFDAAFKLACCRLPDPAGTWCSQPTISRWENAPDLRDLIRPMGVSVGAARARRSGTGHAPRPRSGDRGSPRDQDQIIAALGQGSMRAGNIGCRVNANGKADALRRAGPSGRARRPWPQRTPSRPAGVKMWSAD